MPAQETENARPVKPDKSRGAARPGHEPGAGCGMRAGVYDRCGTIRAMTTESPPSTSASPPPAGAPAPRRRGGLDWGFGIVLVLSVGAATGVLVRDGWRVFLDVLVEDAVLFVEIVPKVIAGTLIGTLVRLLVPRETILRLVGEESGLRGIMLAALFGMLIPGGPFTVFPMAAAFLVAGADRGSTTAFVTAWLLIGLNRTIVWEMPFFGNDFVLQRFVVALPMPVLAGLLARMVQPPRIRKPEAGP
jgi:hypothetical protein